MTNQQQISVIIHNNTNHELVFFESGPPTFENLPPETPRPNIPANDSRQFVVEFRDRTLCPGETITLHYHSSTIHA